MITSFSDILLVVSIVALILIFAGMIASPGVLRQFPQRAFLIVHGILDVVRRGCQSVVRTAYSLLKTAAHSVGISGEHWVQRIVGAIVLSVATVIALFVGFLNIMVSLGGVIGSAAVTILHYLPFSIEEYTALELIFAAVIFGILLLDVLGITHLTKFYSSSYLDKVPRYFLGSLFLIGVLFTAYLFALSGIVRSEVLHAQQGNQSAAMGSHQEIDVPHIYSPDNTNRQDEPFLNEYHREGAISMSDEFVRVSRIMLWGIPLVCVVSGIFSAVGLIPFLGMLITFPLFLLLVIPTGIIYLVTHFLINALDYIYSFILTIYSALTNLGHSIRQLFSKNSTTSNDPGNEQSSDIPGEEDARIYDEQSLEKDEDRMVDTTESSEVNEDWNPLK